MIGVVIEMNKNEILNLVEKVHRLKKGKSNALPENSYFLDRDEILCYPRSGGDSRYPYYYDGLVLFAHSEGYMDCVDGDFNVFKSAIYNEDANIAFFAGEKEDEAYAPISITGAAQQLFEKDIQRYTVFTPVCAYYIVETPKAIYALRTYVDGKKHIRFSVSAINLGEQREVYLCSYFEPTLRNSPHESFFKRMTKYSEQLDQGYLVKTVENVTNCLAIRRKICGPISKQYGTVAKGSFIGRRGGNLTNALALKKGCIDRQVKKMNTVDFPVACDMVHFLLDENGYAEICYEMAVFLDEDQARCYLADEHDAENEEVALASVREKDQRTFRKTVMDFSQWHNDTVHPTVLNHFLGCVMRQVSLCALGKTYATAYLGIRDVFQQLELSLIWQKAESRVQMVRVMDFMLEDGRPPRQITFPKVEGTIPKMDLRPFIDQGFWIISTFHTYLSYTDDFSILDEICGYYKEEKTTGSLSRSINRDSILQHLLKIMRFLISNIDEDTKCMRALFGDWNDALDGLGKTKDPSKEFGNGVSVMATLQFYLSLGQMCEILERIGGYEDVVSQYRVLQDDVAKGLDLYAFLKDDQGVMRVAHGWAEDREFYVGSFCDHDGASRISLTSNAFYAISGLVEQFPQYKEDVVKNIMALDSRFGLLTFDKPFSPNFPQVGRISGITAGTYENACAYVHAGTFGAMALFMMGHSKEAWEILEKLMVISHENVTMTTFVMPNSYCIDGEFDFNGESMGDWYTGSGAVLIKNIIKYGFGIEPMINDVKIIPSAYFPAAHAKITLSICGKVINCEYENRNLGERQIYFNGERLELTFDSIRSTPYVIISKKDLTNDCTILIVD